MSEFWHGTPEVETSRPLVSVVVSVRGNAGSLHGLLTALAGQGPGRGDGARQDSDADSACTRVPTARAMSAFSASRLPSRAS
jgi:hypothetical protein